MLSGGGDAAAANIRLPPMKLQRPPRQKAPPQLHIVTAVLIFLHGLDDKVKRHPQCKVHKGGAHRLLHKEEGLWDELGMEFLWQSPNLDLPPQSKLIYWLQNQ